LLVRLAAADAFRSLGLNRRTALWQALCHGEELPLFDHAEEVYEQTPPFEEMPLEQQVISDFDTTGLSLRAHPISLVRSHLNLLDVLTATALLKAKNLGMVRVAGLVIVRQKPATAKGTIFVTMEDETGNINLVVRPRIWERYRRVARSAAAMIARGRIERTGGVIHILVSEMEDLSDCLKGLATRSRDFH
jgi:error-prone DNA polymerase